jgi:hypothetical protein
MNPIKEYPRVLPDAAPASTQASARTFASGDVSIKNEYPLASNVAQPSLPDVEQPPAGPAFVSTAPALGTDAASSESSLHLPSSTIISFGPHSDTVIDTFGLSDTIIPRLRILVESTRQNKWPQVLQSEHGLEVASASALSNALRADLALIPLINKVSRRVICFSSDQ